MSKMDQFKMAIAVVDTSAMLKEINLLEILANTFYRVVIPQVCVEELSNIKDRSRREGKNSRAWQVLARINKHRDWVYRHAFKRVKNDHMIIDIAHLISVESKRDVYIITDDIDFSCQYEHSLIVGELVMEILWRKSVLDGDPRETERFAELFLDDWSNYELSSRVNINGILPGGLTVLISTIRSNHPKRNGKLQFLIRKGVDLDQNDCEKNFLTPLSHCAQIGDLAALKILTDAGADINKGSQNESKCDFLKCRNEGNTPLMVACFHGRRNIVKYLMQCGDLCYNQQDSNGYTALAKCAIKGYRDLYDLLLPKTDRLIRDRNNHTADWHLTHQVGGQ